VLNAGLDLPAQPLVFVEIDALLHLLAHVLDLADIYDPCRIGEELAAIHRHRQEQSAHPFGGLVAIHTAKLGDGLRRPLDDDSGLLVANLVNNGLALENLVEREGDEELLVQAKVVKQLASVFLRVDSIQHLDGGDLDGRARRSVDATVVLGLKGDVTVHEDAVDDRLLGFAVEVVLAEA
jgi:hypothetical protein